MERMHLGGRCGMNMSGEMPEVKAARVCLTDEDIEAGEVPGSFQVPRCVSRYARPALTYMSLASTSHDLWQPPCLHLIPCSP